MAFCFIYEHIRRDSDRRDRETDQCRIFRFVLTSSDHADIHKVVERHPVAKIEHTKIDSKIGDRSDNDINPIDVVPTHLLIVLDATDNAGLIENDSSRLHMPAVKSVHASTVRTKAEVLS